MSPTAPLDCDSRQERSAFVQAISVIDRQDLEQDLKAVRSENPVQWALLVRCVNDVSSEHVPLEVGQSEQEATPVVSRSLDNAVPLLPQKRNGHLIFSSTSTEKRAKRAKLAKLASSKSSQRKTKHADVGDLLNSAAVALEQNRKTCVTALHAKNDDVNISGEWSITSLLELLKGENENITSRCENVIKRLLLRHKIQERRNKINRTRLSQTIWEQLAKELGFQDGGDSLQRGYLAGRSIEALLVKFTCGMIFGQGGTASSWKGDHPSTKEINNCNTDAYTTAAREQEKHGAHLILHYYKLHMGKKDELLESGTVLGKAVKAGLESNDVGKAGSSERHEQRIAGVSSNPSMNDTTSEAQGIGDSPTVHNVPTGTFQAAEPTPWYAPSLEDCEMTTPIAHDPATTKEHNSTGDLLSLPSAVISYKAVQGEGRSPGSGERQITDGANPARVDSMPHPQETGFPTPAATVELTSQQLPESTEKNTARYSESGSATATAHESVEDETFSTSTQISPFDSIWTYPWSSWDGTGADDDWYRALNQSYDTT